MRISVIISYIITKEEKSDSTILGISKRSGVNLIDIGKYELKIVKELRRSWMV